MNVTITRTSPSPFLYILGLHLFLFFSFDLCGQELESNRKYVHVCYTNGYSVNFSKVVYDPVTTQSLKPTVEYHKGYSTSLGIEMGQKGWLGAVHLKRMVFGNLLNFVAWDSLNAYPLYVGVSRPSWILNASVGRTMNVGKFRLGCKLGLDYLLRYQQNRYFEFSIGMDSASTFFRVGTLVLSNTAIHLLPNAELSCALPIRLKKWRPFCLSYRLSFALGPRLLYRTRYELWDTRQTHIVQNLNKGTYLLNALSLEIPLK